ncbi:hypothetical protein C2845_PM01G39750 [Panicum miliaceum]|uniref:MATH domain-containing protein n=1 Tax=Panicum miliaceum TaxID=4540 RepID=A0A3L6TR87_PANMI|nr:hypothetical protein C2845_PM01G39750 [Panicum miliaceum]
MKMIAPAPALVRKADDPAFEWRICGFSALLERGATPASSALFRCYGYEWFLQVIPMHDRPGAESPYVALGLVLSPTKLKSDYIIDAVFEISMYNHSNGTYCGYKASYSFDVNRTHSEKNCLVPLEQMLKSSDFLVDDICVFAVGILKLHVYPSKNTFLFMKKKHVLVQKKHIIVQNIFLQKKEIIKGTCTWSISNFLNSTLPVHSPSFEVGGHKWFLQVIPMHKKSGDKIPYVALCLCVSQNTLKPGCTLSAVFELSMYNHSKGTYHGCKASYHFRVKQKQSERKCLIPLEELLKSSDFLVDDSCVFSVRILKADVSSQSKPIVIPKKPITVQNIFLQKKGFIKGTYTWTMNNFLDMKLPVLSPAFDVGGQKWHINMHPLGDKYSTNSLSLYLHLHGGKKLPLESGMVIELTLCIMDQKHGKHYTVTGRFVFATEAKSGWGWSNFIPLKTLMDPSRGYLVGSNCILKADATIIGSSNDG